MRVLALVPYPITAPSNRLRIEQYENVLRDHGVEVEISRFLDESSYAIFHRPGYAMAKTAAVLRGFASRLLDVARAHRFDAVIVHREATSLGPPIIERLLRARGIPYVFDFDDAIFLPAAHPANRAWSWLRDPGRARYSAANASVVIVGNDYLGEWARQWNARVRVIPTAVDVERHRPRDRNIPDRRPAILGWVGSSTTAPYLRLLDEPLARLAALHDVRVRVVGGSYSHATVPVDVRPWSIESEPAEIADFDIGLLPAPDDPWSRGKCAFKAELYMASGIPVVASRVGVAPEVIAEAGICVDHPDEWVAALDRLIRDSDLRGRYGRAGRARALELYSIQALAPRLVDALELAVSGS